MYLLGPIMCTLRPRIITPAHVEQLKIYAQNLWRDALTLERLWLEGKLSKYVQISAEEEIIAKAAPWQGKPALIAADGLFGFYENLERITNNRHSEQCSDLEALQNTKKGKFAGIFREISPLVAI